MCFLFNGLLTTDSAFEFSTDRKWYSDTGNWFIMVTRFYIGTFTEIGQKLMKSAIFII